MLLQTVNMFNMFCNLEGIVIMDAVKVYEEYFGKKYDVLAGLINYYKGKGNTIALWGAGKKGTGFLNVADPENKLIGYIFDKDISKVGQIMPTGHVIADYTETNADVVLVANSNFELEVIHLVHKVNPAAKIINIDNIVLGNLNIYDVTRRQEYSIRKVRDCKICAVVILYNPEPEVKENIKSYIDDIDLLYIYDNSLGGSTGFEDFKGHGKVKYIKKEENAGLPCAFNEVAGLAVKENFDWMVTFDQDSFACNGMIQAMRGYAESSMCQQDVAIIAPVTNDIDDKKETQDIYRTFFYKVIQSGAMHNLEIMSRIGNYDEKMFIDEVDYEYCARCIINGYKIVKINNAVLMHNVQDRNVKRQFVNGINILINKFTPDRYYYCYRNALYCYDKYKTSHSIYALDCLNTMKIMETNLEYNNNFEENSKAIKQAVDDYNNGIMGRRRQL